jgi:hypothetical protein
VSDTIDHPESWRIQQIALLGAIGCSTWAVLGSGTCASCEAAAGLLKGKPVATVGVIYYALLLAAALWWGPSLLVHSGVLLAAGVHVGLLTILFHAKIFCAPCLGTALSAFAALALSIRCDPSMAFRASWVIPGAAILVQSWVLLTGALPAMAETRANAERVAEEEFAAPPVASGDVRMVVYTRPDCGYCIQLEREILPKLVREFGPHLKVERRSAEHLPGIPTPTLILTGAEGRRFFPGLPELEALRSTLRTLMEESHGHETVLEKSR